MKALFLVSLLSHCPHDFGDVCIRDDAYCGPASDPKSAMVCQSGELVRVDCPGPTGCSRNGRNSVVCDQAFTPDAGCK